MRRPIEANWFWFAIGVGLCLLLTSCPQPNPPPPPPPPIDVARLYLIHESGDATPATAAVCNDKAWKDRADALALRWLIADDDSAQKLLPDVVTAARDCGLPAVVLTDSDGGVITAVPMPADTAGMLSLVEEHGG